MNLVKSIDFFQYVLTDHSGKADHPEFISPEEEQIEAPQSAKVFKKFELFLNSGQCANFDLSDLNDSEKDEFLGMLYELLNYGVVECESVEKEGTSEKLYLVNELADDWTEGI